MPVDRTLSSSPHCSGAAASAVVYDYGELRWSEATAGGVRGAPPAPSVCSACALISAIWDYIIDAWSPNGRM